MVEGVNGLLFNPHDENDMRSKIEKMLCLTTEQRNQMGRKSREIAEEKFSTESFVHKYMEIIGA